LPPTPRRGLVLVDPSYEVKTEYAAAAEKIAEACASGPKAPSHLVSDAEGRPARGADRRRQEKRRAAISPMKLHQEIPEPPRLLLPDRGR